MTSNLFFASLASGGIRQVPTFSKSQDGSTLYCAFENMPSGVPADLPLEPKPRYLAVRMKAWNRAQKRAEQLQSERLRG